MATISLTLLPDHAARLQTYFIIFTICSIVAFIGRFLIKKKFKLDPKTNLIIRGVLTIGPWLLPLILLFIPGLPFRTVQITIWPTVGLGLGWLLHESWEKNKEKKAKRNKKDNPK